MTTLISVVLSIISFTISCFIACIEMANIVFENLCSSTLILKHKIRITSKH